ncbi:hypothetical protein F750_3627 [Streptomyces sp. PAMC 26508]|nr:hypothetical protein F750_3627 [Streptomyces sp. PAMC 26508]
MRTAQDPEIGPSGREHRPRTAAAGVRGHRGGGASPVIPCAGRALRGAHPSNR